MAAREAPELHPGDSSLESLLNRMTLPTAQSEEQHGHGAEEQEKGATAGAPADTPEPDWLSRAYSSYVRVGGDAHHGRDSLTQDRDRHVSLVGVAEEAEAPNWLTTAEEMAGLGGGPGPGSSSAAAPPRPPLGATRGSSVSTASMYSEGGTAQNVYASLRSIPESMGVPKDGGGVHGSGRRIVGGHDPPWLHRKAGKTRDDSQWSSSVSSLYSQGGTALDVYEGFDAGFAPTSYEGFEPLERRLERRPSYEPDADRPINESDEEVEPEPGAHEAYPQEAYPWHEDEARDAPSMARSQQVIRSSYRASIGTKPSEVIDARLAALAAAKGGEHRHRRCCGPAFGEDGELCVIS